MRELLVILLAFAPGIRPLAAGVIETGLSIQGHPGKIRLSWSPSSPGPDHAIMARRWQVERSPDLQTWSADGPEIATEAGTSLSAVDVIPRGTRNFFRLRAWDDPVYFATDDGEAMGYASAYAAALGGNSALSPVDLPKRYRPAQGLDQVSCNVENAEYWTEWNTDPAVWNATLPANSPDRRLTDFRLNAAEAALLRRNGFVVSEQRGSYGFADLYYRIWMDDLPVFVSSDSILHAWHRTWVTILEEMEELSLQGMLAEMLPMVAGNLGSGNSLCQIEPGACPAESAAYQLIVTADVLLGYRSPSPVPAGWAGKAIAATGWSDEDIFGGDRVVDWSQFQPRGHYTNSEALQGWFRAVMWLGTMDLRLDERDRDGRLRQLSSAALIALAMKYDGLMDKWRSMDAVLTPFMGQPDCLTPPQLLEILAAENVTQPAQAVDPATLERLLVRLQSGQAGVQQILGTPIYAPLGERKLVLPRSFAFFGRRFTPESWALGSVVFDKIWRVNPDPEGPPLYRVRRRLPSSLDVCFSVLGNNTPAGLLAERMQNPQGVPFRDGYDYSRELVSVRQVMDGQGPSAWTGSLYMHALNAMRTLSAPLPDSVPESLRTKAWNWKMVHTQMAAWTELRHDFVLYAKQSYTPPVLCYYPAGYVEPRPAFYQAMKQLVEYARGALAQLPAEGVYPGRLTPEGFVMGRIDRAVRKAEWLSHLDGMAVTLETLKGMAEKEVAREEFTPAQMSFLRSLVQRDSFQYGGELRTYSGWYPQLYLQSLFRGTKDPHPSEKWDPLVVDVHTDGADQQAGDPGAVLYNSTGNVAFMLVCIDVNGQLCLHGAPVFTHYEFSRPLDVPRMDDAQWKDQVRARQQPAHPAWTESFLVPGPITIPEGIK